MNSLINNLVLKTGLLLITVLCTLKASAQVIEPLPQLHKDFQIVVHLIHGNNVFGSTGPGIDQQSVLDVVGELNVLFDPIDVNFSVCEFNEIENYQHDTIGDDSRTELIIKYGRRKRINVFLFDSIVPKDSPINPAGNADLGGISQDVEGRHGVFIENDNMTIGVFSHEMGHFFGLEHTFGGDITELADGSNCATAGDLVCDTPADPYSPGDEQDAYITNCVYTYGAIDGNGDYYSAMVNNIMSYYSGCDPQVFTNGQYVRMVDVYSANPRKW